MAEAIAVETVPGQLLELAGRLRGHSDFAAVVRSLEAGHGATLDGVWGSSCALVAAALAQRDPLPAGEGTKPLVVVCPRAGDVDDFCDDLALFTTLPCERLPAWEVSGDEAVIQDEAFGDRLRILKMMPADAPPLIVTSIQALLQPVPDRQALAQQTRRLRINESVDVTELVRWLVEQGFHHTTAVELPGEVAVRGGIVDIFAPDWDRPVRAEFFGDQIESLRWFEVSSQRSLAALAEVDVTVVPAVLGHRDHFAAHLPAGSWFLLVEPAELEEEAKHYLERSERPQDLHRTADVLKRIYEFPSVTAAAIAQGSLETTCHLSIESVERFSGDIGKVRDELDAAAGDNDVFIVCPTDAEIKRLQEIFGQTRLATAGKLHFATGRLQHGFRLVSEHVAIVGGGELFQRSELGRPTRRRLGRIIDSFLDLREGDYVVHLSHGIGRYRGLKLLEKDDQVEEHLELEFHGGTKIFVPATNIELVQKYVGGAKGRPTLAHIGGRMWSRQKDAARQAVTDLAAEMLQLQAMRALRPGLTFPPDTPWQREFDASFPYRETPDQLTAIAEIKRDMQAPRPMDRLLCGDVGYGKTELAARAAFKAIDAGFQVGILVPTTILAEQHLRTFRARMSEFPFEVAALSRFCTAKQQSEIIAGLAEGTIDIVIGTHRLAQHDVTFKNLGLVIIDEEQRFGVEVKERLKALRHTVDVLTLTATPIPRTLHMSLLGLRDISNLETPPEDRLAVETRVARFQPDLIRHAIMRELNRDGQVFFVHNRIADIELLASKLQRIVPEATISIGHGQMPEGQLEKVMLDFVDHKFDILLSTTIVESGLDIPNANTILIDDADQYGLADLHQLRGRVGRYKHRAYCYLLIDQNKHLSSTSAKRLRAIEEFSDMGAGFAIAMRDLEIRGAGNILGTQQSGHIAAVGYELYCELLEQAVRKLKQMAPRATLDVHVDLPSRAFIPPAYVPDLRAKIDLYRRLARVTTDAELDDLTSEMVDRFGPRPVTVDGLITLARLRIAAAGWSIDSMHLEDEYAVFTYLDKGRIHQLAQANPGRLRVVDDRSAYMPLDKEVAAQGQVLTTIESLLRPRAAASIIPPPFPRSQGAG